MRFGLRNYDKLSGIATALILAVVMLFSVLPASSIALAASSEEHPTVIMETGGCTPNGTLSVPDSSIPAAAIRVLRLRESSPVKHEFQDQCVALQYFAETVIEPTLEPGCMASGAVLCGVAAPKTIQKRE